MQAIILAAGMGNRLGKHTKNKTKCMLKINNKTLIEHTLDKLNNLKIKKVIIVVGHKKENLIEHIGYNYKNIIVEYIENKIFHKTNNIYSLFLAKDKMSEDDTILLESDLIFEEIILQRLLEDKRPSLAVVDKYQLWMDGASITLSREDKILAFFTKKIFNFKDIASYYKTVNIYKFSNKFINETYIPFLEAYTKAMGSNEYYENVLRVLVALEQQELRAMRLNGEKWYEIDDVQDMNNAKIIFASSAKEKLKLIQARYGGYWRFPKLKDFCYLVNPYFPTTKMQDEMKASFYKLLSQYPSGQNTQKSLAGKMFKIEKNNILVGNGATEIIRGLSKIITGTFGIVFPTFNEYPESIGYNRVVKFIPQNKSFTYGINEIIELANKCDNLLLINPDNPSGNFIDKDQLLKTADILLKMNKKFILDESFVDFSSETNNKTMLFQDILDRYKNLIIIKSISKSYGVPGIRLGILATANVEIMSRIEKEISIWNINSYAEFFLQIIDKYKYEYNESCKKIISERNRFFNELKNITYLHVIHSHANYFLAYVVDKFTATELSEMLLDKYNLYIKDLTGKVGFDGRECIRIAVNSYQENESLIKILNEIKISVK
jgi:histidinol-phosphate/aromatic aminotransferase/cobyric acid decarboxylase-like protein/choline kinase